MLGQSMGFYQDEFAGRMATKVMQTALAVRDVWMIFADILTYVHRHLLRHHGGRGGRLRLRWRDGCPAGLAAAVRRCAAPSSCRAWPRWRRTRPTPGR
jgi:hypothetical protein